MKRVFLTAGVLALAIGSQALAADLPPAAAPPPRAPAAYIPAPVFSWTGVYVGINGGYEFGQSSWNNPNPIVGNSGNFTTNGGLVGGTLGGNYQFGAFVIGGEGDIDWQNPNGSFGNCSTTGGFATCTTQSEWLATIRGRAGWAVYRVLFYGTGGVAFGDIRVVTTGTPFTDTTQVGWTAGAGVEWAFLPNWTAKFEYLYVNLGNAACGLPSCAAGTSVSLTENVVRAGVNFKFW